MSSIELSDMHSVASMRTPHDIYMDGDDDADTDVRLADDDGDDAGDDDSDDDDDDVDDDDAGVSTTPS